MEISPIDHGIGAFHSWRGPQTFPNNKQIHTMKMNKRAVALCLSLGITCGAEATISAWQTEVGLGTAPASTVFNTTSDPILHDVGALTGARSFEFIVNADAVAGVSTALMGARPGWGIKFEQWNNTGTLGLTQFGVADHISAVPSPVGDAQVVFTTDGTNGTNIYVNGTFAQNMAQVVNISGPVGLGGVYDGGPFFDVLDGDILGFASYDSELSAVEVQTHSDAFFVPEPSSVALLGLGGLALLVRRRR